MFASMFAATMRRCGVGRTVSRCTMPSRCVCPVIVVDACCRRTTSIGCIPAPGVSARARVAASVVPASAAAAEAMLTPAVAVSPVCPRAHAQEDAVIEISRPIKAARRAAIRCIVVVAVGTDWRYADAYADCDLRTGHWRQGQQQGCCTRQKQTAHCQPAGPWTHAFELPHFVVLLNIRLRWKGMVPLSASGAGIAGQYRPFSAAGFFGSEES